MLWTKRQNITLPCHRLSSEQEALKVTFLGLGLIFLLRLLDSGVVICEDKCVLVIWVLVALGARVARTEVAGRVVGWEGGFGGGLLLSSGI